MNRILVIILGPLAGGRSGIYCLTDGHRPLTALLSLRRRLANKTIDYDTFVRDVGPLADAAAAAASTDIYIYIYLTIVM